MPLAGSIIALEPRLPAINYTSHPTTKAHATAIRTMTLTVSQQPLSEHAAAGEEKCTPLSSLQPQVYAGSSAEGVFVLDSVIMCPPGGSRQATRIRHALRAVAGAKERRLPTDPKSLLSKGVALSAGRSLLLEWSTVCCLLVCRKYCTLSVSNSSNDDFRYRKGSAFRGHRAAHG